MTAQLLDLTSGREYKQDGRPGDAYRPCFVLRLSRGRPLADSGQRRRPDWRQIDAARDLGASPFSAFRRVTLPLSKVGILAGCVLVALPMFGDYYTPDLVSASTKTNLIGNHIDQFTRQGSEKVTGAVLTLFLSAFLLLLMFYYLRTTRQAGNVTEEE